MLSLKDCAPFCVVQVNNYYAPKIERSYSTLDAKFRINNENHVVYFHFGYEEHVLFYDWHADSPGAMLGACCAIFLLAVLYEGFGEYRAYLKDDQSHSPALNESESTNLLVEADNKFM
ncbi:high affinity copper uptake protein 1-like [Elysia marginata]|uniref:Copper transport protein n=1 Tax=Elysia marginata TaxID=1093978 RepID=A0AAV4I6L2_9GAST|nr:high affinity copper uptake protein 1-like [Elysia marginata]